MFCYLNSDCSTKYLLVPTCFPSGAAYCCRHLGTIGTGFRSDSEKNMMASKASLTIRWAGLTAETPFQKDPVSMKDIFLVETSFAWYGNDSSKMSIPELEAGQVTVNEHGRR